MSRCATLEDLRWRLAFEGAWPGHSVLLSLLRVLSEEAGEEVGYLVAYRSDRVPHLSWDPATQAAPRVCIALFHHAAHYQLLADQEQKLVYCPAKESFEEFI